MKFKTGLVTEVEEQIKEEHEQEGLKVKHKIEGENVVVVEKNNYLKWIAAFIRTCAAILLFVFAAVGIVAIIYPEPREALISVLSEVYKQVIEMFA